MDACSPTSSLDCGSCTATKRFRIEGRSRCVSMCTSTTQQCRRLSLNIKEVDMCLQHCVMKADRLSAEQRSALLLFINTSLMHDDKKREYELMVRGRALPTDVRKYMRSFVDDLDKVLHRKMLKSNIAANSIESIELLRTVYKLDTDIHLLRDTMPLSDAENLDPTIPYHIWCTDVKKTTELVNAGELTNVTIISTDKGQISTGLCSFCTELQKVHFILPFVTHIGDNWVQMCWSLTHVSFDLANLREVGNHWLSGSGAHGGIQPIRFIGLPRLSSVKDSWMRSSRVIDLDFTGMGELVSVGHNWLSGSLPLQAPRFYGLKTLESVGDYWMDNCRNLTKPDFQGLGALKTVGVFWMSSCTKLPDDIDLSGMENVISIGGEFMNHRSRRRGPRLTYFPKLTT
jgi:hypothetical protein